LTCLAVLVGDAGDEEEDASGFVLRGVGESGEVGGNEATYVVCPVDVDLRRLDDFEGGGRYKLYGIGPLRRGFHCGK
jgi:hypothetical protein